MDISSILNNNSTSKESLLLASAANSEQSSPTTTPEPELGQRFSYEQPPPLLPTNSNNNNINTRSSAYQDDYKITNMNMRALKMSEIGPTRSNASSTSGYSSSTSTFDPGYAAAAQAVEMQKCSSDSGSSGGGGKRVFSCGTCGKDFARRSDLGRHEKIHTGERPNQCDICSKSFIQRSALTVHRRVHTGEKPHTCQACDKSFGDSSSLARHRRVHTGARPYVCQFPRCMRQFTRRNTLNKHLKVHPGWTQETSAITARSRNNSTGSNSSLASDREGIVPLSDIQDVRRYSGATFAAHRHSIAAGEAPVPNEPHHNLLPQLSSLVPQVPHQQQNRHHRQETITTTHAHYYYSGQWSGAADHDGNYQSQFQPQPQQRPSYSSFNFPAQQPPSQRLEPSSKTYGHQSGSHARPRSFLASEPRALPVLPSAASLLNTASVNGSKTAHSKMDILSKIASSQRI